MQAMCYDTVKMSQIFKIGHKWRTHDQQVFCGSSGVSGGSRQRIIGHLWIIPVFSVEDEPDKILIKGVVKFVCTV